MSYLYRQDILEALLAHGVRPTRRTSPKLARDFVRDLYKYQLKQLRERLLCGEFPRKDYAARVTELRNRYRVLALGADEWLVLSSKGDADIDETRSRQ